MNPIMTNTIPTETRPEERSRRIEAEETTRELERIRASYLTIRAEELERLDRIAEAWKDE